MDITKILSSRTETRKLPENLNEKDLLIFEHELNKDLQATNLYVLNSVYINSDFFVFKYFNPIYNTNINSSRILNKKYSIKNKIIFFYQNQIRRKKLKFETAFWLTDNWSKNYFHWFTDVLPKLYIVNKNYKNEIVILRKGFENIDYIKKTLQMFENIEFQYIRTFQIAKIKKLNIISPTAPTGNYNSDLIKEMRFFLLSLFSKKISKKTVTRIFISRKKARNRKVINETEIISVLKKYDFEIIDFENYTWLEQMQFCFNAEYLIGVHGAGLTNMLFMKDYSKILELRRNDDTHNNCYFSLANALNFKYFYQLSKVDDYKKRTQENNFYVDKNELEINITEMIKIDK